LVNELNLDPTTKVKIKDIDVELIEGDLQEKPWLIEDKEKNYVLMEEEQYDKLILLLRNILEENLELKIDSKIVGEFAVDPEDVKTVVKNEIKNNNLHIDDVIKKIKREHPNLFYQVKLEEVFNLE